MFPYLNIMELKIPMYGLLILTACIVGVLIAIYSAKKQKQNRDDILYSGCFALVGAILGSKILYLITVLPYLISNFSYIISNKEVLSNLMIGGFVFYGGVIGGALGIFIYSKMYKISFLAITDTVTVAIPIGHAIGRIGCLCAGCCYGMPMNPPWGFDFSNGIAHTNEQFLFPIQLAEAIVNICIFVFLVIYIQKQRPKGKTSGMYLLLYSVARFCLEYFRYDTQRGMIFGLSTSQWISIGIILFSFYLLNYNKIKSFKKV